MATYSGSEFPYGGSNINFKGFFLGPGKSNFFAVRQDTREKVFEVVLTGETVSIRHLAGSIVNYSVDTISNHRTDVFVGGVRLLTYTDYGLGVHTTSPEGALHVVPKAADHKGVTVQAVIGQSAKLIDVKDASGASKFSVSPQGVLNIASYTTSQLPAGSAGQVVYVSDGLKEGESPGQGTGALAYHDGTAWYNVAGGTSGGGGIAGLVKLVKADQKSIANVPAPYRVEGSLVASRGFYVPDDGGGALYKYYPDDTRTSDGVLVVRPSDFESDATPGRWVFTPHTTYVHPAQFGAVGDSVIRAFDSEYAGYSPWLSSGDATFSENKSRVYACLSNIGISSVTGTWFELMTSEDTLDGVGYHLAYAYAAKNGLNVFLGRAGGGKTVLTSPRSFWIGIYADHGTRNVPSLKTYAHLESGTVVYGHSTNTRGQADLPSTCAFKVTGDIATRLLLRAMQNNPLEGGPGSPITGGSVQLRADSIPGAPTVTVEHNDTPATLLSKLNDWTGGTCTVTCPNGDSNTPFSAGKTFVIRISRKSFVSAGTESFGNFSISAQNLTTSGDNQSYARVYKDGYGVAFVGSAQVGQALKNVNIVGSYIEASSMPSHEASNYTFFSRKGYRLLACVGYTHTASNRIRIDEVFGYIAHYGVEMVENDTANGERCTEERCGWHEVAGWRNFIAPQAFGCDAFNIGEIFPHGDLPPSNGIERVLYTLGRSERVQGYGMTNTNISASFPQTPTTTRNVVVKSMADTLAGLMNDHFTMKGGRIEHPTTIVSIPFSRSGNQNGMFVFEDLKFTSIVSSNTQPLIYDSSTSSAGKSQHRIVFRNCVFEAETPGSVLILVRSAISGQGDLPHRDARFSVTFEDCEFKNWGGIDRSGLSNVVFSRCRMLSDDTAGLEPISYILTDAVQVRANPGPNGDKSFSITSGPRENRLGFNLLQGQADGDDIAIATGTHGWTHTLVGNGSAQNLHKFRRAGSAEAPFGTASNGIQVEFNTFGNQVTRLAKTVGSIDLNSGASNIVWITFTCLAQVAKGGVRISLRRSTDAKIFDAVTLIGDNSLFGTDNFGPWQRVTLRAAVRCDQGTGAVPMVAIDGLNDFPVVRIVEPQLYTGLGEKSYVPCPTDTPVVGTDRYDLSAPKAVVTGQFGVPSLVRDEIVSANREPLVGEIVYDTTENIVRVRTATGWVCVPSNYTSSVSGLGDADYTWNLGNGNYFNFGTTLTSHRTLTLSTAGVPAGYKVRVERTASGAFELRVPWSTGGSRTKALDPNTFAVFVYDGAAWQLEANGSL